MSRQLRSKGERTVRKYRYTRCTAAPSQNVNCGAQNLCRQFVAIPTTSRRASPGIHSRLECNPRLRPSLSLTSAAPPAVSTFFVYFYALSYSSRWQMSHPFIFAKQRPAAGALSFGALRSARCSQRLPGGGAHCSIRAFFRRQIALHPTFIVPAMILSR